MPRPQRNRVAASRVPKNDITTDPKTTRAKPEVMPKISQPQRTTRLILEEQEADPIYPSSDEAYRTTPSSGPYYMTGALPIDSDAQLPLSIDVAADTSSNPDAADQLRVINYYNTRVGRSAAWLVSSPKSHGNPESTGTAPGVPRNCHAPVIRGRKTCHAKCRVVHTSSRVTSASTQTRQAVKTSTPRAQTPQLSEGPHGARDYDELFGLSPDGMAARARRASARQQQTGQSRRTSRQNSALPLRELGTPAAESSVRALGRFKRRKRQGSIIRQMQEASELNTNLDDELNLDDTNFGLEDFNPDDESTPIHAKTTRITDGLESEGPRTSSSRKRKFAETQVQVPQSPESPLSSSPLSSPSELSGDDLPEAPAEQDIIPATQDDSGHGDTVAPPLSSSSLLSDPPSSSSSSVEPPARRRTRGPEISTLHLQSLLPRTRRGKAAAQETVKNVYSEPSSLTEPTSEVAEPLSSDAENEPANQDEPFNARSRPRRTTARTRNQPIKPTKPQIPRRKPLQSKKAVNTNKKQPIQAASSTSSKKPVRKYGRRHEAEEDKENDDVDDDDNDDTHVTFDESTVVEDKARSKVMQKVRDKFAEIDEWEMEYESVDFSNASSPWR